MNNLLKYFISLIIVFIAFIGYTNSSNHTVDDNCNYNQTSDVISHYTDFSTANSDLLLPCKTSPTNVLRPQNASKRNCNTHKNNFEFIKAGKVINIGIRNFCQNNSLKVHSSFTKPANMLISLGKLII